MGTVPHPDVSQYPATTDLPTVLADAGDLVRSGLGRVFGLDADFGAQRMSLGELKDPRTGELIPPQLPDKGYETRWNPQDPNEVVGGPADPFAAVESDVLKAASNAAKLQSAAGMSPLMMKLEKAKAELEAITPRTAFQARYPVNGEPVPTYYPETKKWGKGKGASPESLAVQKVRLASQQVIDAGEYTPYFDVSRRFHVDPANYPLTETTLESVRPAKASTEAKYAALAGSREAEKRLIGAFHAAKADPLAHDWYAMGQLESEYVRTLGAKQGRAAFKKNFADAMAATTGGANPKDNLVMSHYGNFQRTAGEAIPENAYDLPFPIGGRYASGNMKMYDRVINQGEGLPVSTPKRHNFSGNFQGHTELSTIDEQMSRGFDPGMAAPPQGSYGVYESAIARFAKKAKAKSPSNFQEVAWAGLKGSKGKPMIQEINEAIERTHHITGLPKDQILNRMIKGTIPMFGLAGAAYLSQGEPASADQ